MSEYRLKIGVFARTGSVWPKLSGTRSLPYQPFCMFRDCNPGFEFLIPGFRIVEFPIPGSRDPVWIGVV